MTYPFIAVVLGLLAGAMFGLLVHFQKRGLANHDPLSGAFVSVAAMTLFLWILSPFFIELAWFTTPAALLFFVAGIIFPAAGQTFQVLAIGRVGPALTTAMGAFAPFFAAVPAVMILHEPMGIKLALGMGLMTAGLLLAGLGAGRMARTWPLWALLLPLGAAATRGLVMPVTKLGLNVLASPFFATLVMGSVSTIVMAIVLAATGRSKGLLPEGSGVKWFALGGVTNACGILSVNTAIGLGGVTLAAPLAATAPLWALLFGYFIFKNEALGKRHLVIAMMVVIGAVLIVTR